MINYMICPCCGGTIELENDSEGVCDVCETRVIAGEIIRDANYAENEKEESRWTEKKSVQIASMHHTKPGCIVMNEHATDLMEQNVLCLSTGPLAITFIISVLM